jgi:hypothetical protein
MFVGRRWKIYAYLTHACGDLWALICVYMQLHRACASRTRLEMSCIQFDLLTIFQIILSISDASVFSAPEP